tara:strand:- start:263 stop:400 length:138 start_codon:yes stop_codon:yes gene_type:complete
MTDENNKSNKQCGGRVKAMFAYGVIQLGYRMIDSIDLASIAFSFN